MKKSLLKNILLSCAASLVFNFSSAQPGTLDATFGTGGKVIQQINSLISYAYTTAVQSDGKILVAGNAKISNTTLQPCIVRYNSNGTLDNTFGTNGQVQTPFGNDTVVDIHSIVIQPDGKIIGGGSYGPGVLFSYPQRNLFLIRYNTNGTIDPTFGNGGYTQVNVSNGIFGDVIKNIALQPDGKIVACGVANAGNNPNYHYDFMTARFTASGALDNTFGTGGFVITDLGNEIEYATSVIVQPDNKILVAGTFAAPTYAYVVLRYESTGVLDNSFATNGRFNTTFGSNDICNAMVLQTNGSIVLNGSATQGSLNGIGMVRITSAGVLDNSFGTGGKFFHNINGNLTSGYGLLLQPDGKLISCGSVNAATYDFALTRVNSNGTIDNSFGTNGDATFDFAAAVDESYAMAFQPDLKIIVAGIATTSSGISYGVARVASGLTVGIENLSADENKFIVYPNPATEYIALSSPFKTNTNCEVKIFDIMGKEVQRLIVESPTLKIDLQKLEDGIYFLQFNTQDEISTQKFVVHH